MKNVIAVVVVVAVLIAVFYARRAHAPSPPRTSAAPADDASPARAAATAPTNSPTPAAQPHAVKRIDAQTRAELLRRIDTALHHATPSQPSAAAPRELDQDYIQDRIRELLPLLTECYSNALRRNANLAGKLVVDFSIVGDPDVGGIVGESKINGDESTIADGDMRECVQQTMYAAQFVPPKAGGEVHVTYPFVFSR